MEELDSELSCVDKARLFWSTQDLDSVFCEIQNHLNQLQTKLQSHTASDKDLVQSLKLLEAFDWPFVTTGPVVQVVIGSDAEPSTAPPVIVPETAPISEGPKSPVPPEYKEHFCSKSCLPTLPRMPETRLWALNPLKVPLVYGFHRSRPKVDQSEQSVQPVDQSEESVVYTAPCGLRLCNYDDVMEFLLMSETFHLLQLDLFSFSACVSVDPGPDPGCSPGPDLSRGQELTPVELSVGEGEGAPVFKYRRDRWPRGCFLSNTPDLYGFFCDCRGRCGAGGDCACVSMTTGHGYKHGRLQEPNDNGIFECGPWCGCDPGLCQNRVVQKGLRVRLQIYRTKTQPDPSPDQPEESSPDQSQDPRLDRGWGVRCKDDLEQGTFICVYAGLVLQRGDGQSEAPPTKQRKAELAADDEIQLVTEWLPNTATNTDTAHVPVIQRGSDITDKVTVNGSKRPLDQTQTRTLGSNDFHLIDASKEGNASRFFNHSCDPTLFVQNVFTDSHDKRFPHIAFFTKRALKAGTELTWDYNSAPSQEVKGVGQEVKGVGQEVEEGVQEVPCLCRSEACRQRFYITELKKPTVS